MASDGAKWSKDEVNALMDAYSDAKTSATTMSTNRELYASILVIAVQVSMTIRDNRRLSS